MCSQWFACTMRAERQHTKHVFLYLNSLCNQADQLILVFSDAIFSHRKGFGEECRTSFEYRWSKENDTKLWGDRSHWPVRNLYSEKDVNESQLRHKYFSWIRIIVLAFRRRQLKSPPNIRACYLRFGFVKKEIKHSFVIIKKNITHYVGKYIQANLGNVFARSIFNKSSLDNKPKHPFSERSLIIERYRSG